MTLIYGQCNKATLTKLAFRNTYKADYNNGNLVSFFNQLRVVCYKSNDDGLSYKPYKIVVVIKPLHNFTNSTQEVPHGYKEEVKVKYDTRMAIVRNFPNGTRFLEMLLAKEKILLNSN